MPVWHSIIEDLKQHHGVTVDANWQPQPVSGGDINAAWRVQTSDGDLFMKTSGADAFEMFSAEADGLQELDRASAVRVPVVVACGVSGPDAWIALEWLAFSPSGSKAAERLGRRLATLHRTVAKRHGWHRDNTIGLTPQPNDRTDRWVDFFHSRRLVHQLRLAETNGYGGELLQEGMRLAENLDRLLHGHDPEASLLHGDLWGGNWSAVGGEPVIFDPAVYFGDRETDLAMTRLFGGFGSRFYAAYQEAWPLADGHERRCRLYQLYHVLNHLNLFGTGYLGRSMELIRSLS